MKRKKLNALLAQNPTPELLETCLYIVRHKTPLPLFYLQKIEDRWEYKETDDVLTNEIANLVGIRLGENTILRLKAFTKEDAELLSKSLPLFEDVSVDDIKKWVYRNFAYFPDPHPANEEDIKLFTELRPLVKQTLEILKYYEVPIPHPSWKSPGYVRPTYGIACNGGHHCFFVVPYLKAYGDLLIFSGLFC